MSETTSGKPRDYMFCPFCARTLETKLEEGKCRKYCRECNWTYYPTPPIGVSAIIPMIVGEEDGPCVLMVKRKREPYEGTWMFPAGFLEWGEHPEDTLRRDALKEETGLTLVTSKLIRIDIAREDPRYPNHLVLFYRATAMGKIENNDPDENSSVQWKSIYRPVDIGFPHHRIVFDDIVAFPTKYFGRF